MSDEIPQPSNYPQIRNHSSLIQNLATNYMPLMILSSAIISSFLNADFKGITFITTAFMWVGMCSMAINSFEKKKNRTNKQNTICHMSGAWSWFRDYENDAQTILMGYTLGWIGLCLYIIWNICSVPNQIGIVMLLSISSILNCVVRSDLLNRRDLACVSINRWLCTFGFGVIGGVAMFILAQTIAKSKWKEHMFYNFGTGDGRSKSAKTPYYYCTDQNA